ncbi:hypothetical protein [Nocardiopsis halophila]|uniref:hypothetical protein n=1 Tax=Nocardiopsis halophila TaxID=141692 RepID=UPI001F4CBACF|nr:hypothetical protein [Nocardiopsis halophila]
MIGADMKRITTAAAATAAATALALSVAAPVAAATGPVFWSFPDGFSYHHDNPAMGCHTVADFGEEPTERFTNATDSLVYVNAAPKCLAASPVPVSPGASTNLPVMSYYVTR